MSSCQRRGTATRPSLLYDDFAGTCDSYFENEDSPWKLPPALTVRRGTSRTATTDNVLKNRIARLEERVAQLESSKENLTGTGIEIKSFYIDPVDPSKVVGFVSGADRRFKFSEAISLPDAASLPNVDPDETKIIIAPASLDAEPVVTPPEAPPMTPLRSPGDLGIRPGGRRSPVARRSTVKASQPTLQEQIEMKRAGLRRAEDRPARDRVGSGGDTSQGMTMMEQLRANLRNLRAGLREDNSNGDDEEWDPSPPRRSPSRR